MKCETLSYVSFFDEMKTNSVSHKIHGRQRIMEELELPQKYVTDKRWLKRTLCGTFRIILLLKFYDFTYHILKSIYLV